MSEPTPEAFKAWLLALSPAMRRRVWRDIMSLDATLEKIEEALDQGAVVLARREMTKKAPAWREQMLRQLFEPRDPCPACGADHIGDPGVCPRPDQRLTNIRNPRGDAPPWHGHFSESPT